MNAIISLRFLLLLSVIIIAGECFITYNFHKPISLYEKFRPTMVASSGGINRREASAPPTEAAAEVRPKYDNPQVVRVHEGADVLNMYHRYYPWTMI
ncbi:hypothetical protein DdX_16229 [Ditylenchus destructor]|uniref:Secreted protein n=1 Tax=Ditylenchus destructor TaxID=166010 RepID=A0AAD4MTV3_9BILA|nr:hypothetical protein DdX_16229 [Ditylenchus destructor]